MRKATASLADASTLTMYDTNATIITNSTSSGDTNDGSVGISYRGWTFRSMHGPILDSNQRDSVASDIAKEYNSSNSNGNVSSNAEVIANASDDKILINDSILRLPSAIFDDYVTISNSSIDFNFRAKDALVCWVHQHSNSNSIEVLQVPYATAWKEKQQYGKSKEPGTSEFICNEMRKWDWTFSTEYDCSYEHQYDDDSNNSTLFTFSSSSSSSSSSENATNSKMKYAVNVKDLSRNLTASSSSSTAASSSSTAAASSSTAAAAASNDSVKGAWFQTDTSGIDIALLSQTNVPILFYDEIILYQDDLDDCGESTLDIKIRVMPDCWFVLKRLFIRVDDVKVRIRDCRLFHKFGEPLVHMEVTWKEASLPLPQLIQTVLIKSALQSSGLPMHLNSQALPPSVLLKSGALAQHLPSIMEHEKLHPFYSMVI